MRKVISVTVGPELLNKVSVAAKFLHASESMQDGPEEVTGKVALLLFPELFKTRDSST